MFLSYLRIHPSIKQHAQIFEPVLLWKHHTIVRKRMAVQPNIFVCDNLDGTTNLGSFSLRCIWGPKDNLEASLGNLIEFSLIPNLDVTFQGKVTSLYMPLGGI
jgi:hypothetical protein